MYIKNLIFGIAIEVILFNEGKKKMFIFNYKRFKLNEIIFIQLVFLIKVK